MNRPAVWWHNWKFYDIMGAEEKQAQRGLRARGICFSCAINEKAFDEVKQESARRHAVAIKHELSSLNKTT